MIQTYNPNTWEVAEGTGIQDYPWLKIVKVSLGYMRLSERMSGWILLRVIYSFTSLLGLAGLDNVRFTIQH